MCVLIVMMRLNGNGLLCLCEGYKNDALHIVFSIQLIHSNLLPFQKSFLLATNSWPSGSATSVVWCATLMNDNNDNNDTMIPTQSPKDYMYSIYQFAKANTS